ncbi:hypothetical protein VPNG_01476 [Cytospora leucostoma]|uniref:F-box domain-containing protein n=1 Tax=Cytospora leucostoma TaxID=1230097 RepID=A0A423XKZ4_9PEZI|nr:hypothetical protein VPNG_01476 [Cytospora leucostoma]
MASKNKGMHVAVQRVLYRTISIHQLRTLVRLYRSLVANPELRAYVKRIDIHDIYEQDLDLTPLRCCNESGFDEYWTRCPLIQAGLAWADIRRMNTALIMTLVLKVLSLTPSIEALNLTVTPYFPPSLEDLHFISDRASALQAFSSLWDNTSLPPLPMLKSLHLNGGLHDGHVWKRYDRAMGPLLEGFLALPQVRDLGWSFDKEAWGGIYHRSIVPHSLHPGPCPRQVIDTARNCETLTSLKLYERICLSELISMCGFFPNLESLSVSFLDYGLDYLDYPVTAGYSVGISLSDALSSLTHLQELCLDFEDLPDFLPELLGASGVLKLDSLKHLHTLEVPVQAFVPGKNYGPFQPASVLPRSLRSLTLVDQPHFHEYAAPWQHPALAGPPALQPLTRSPADLINFLEELCKTCRADFPRLREVSYLENLPCKHIVLDGQVRHVTIFRNHRDHNCPGSFSSRFQFVSDSFEQDGVRLGAIMGSGNCVEDREWL